jgi:hypothetical protein
MATQNDLNSVGVLIPGYHLKADQWENVVFGDIENKRLGRVSTAIEEAIKRKAAFIFWGAGGSETENGLKESEYTYQQATGPKLKLLAWHVKKDSDELYRYLQRVSFLETSAKDTAGEIRSAVKECELRGIKELILVSSPTHLPRCMKEACLLKEQSPDISVTFYGRASDTCFANTHAADVTIIEPPHRSDIPQVAFNQTLRDLFQFSKKPELALALNTALSSLIAQYKVQLEKKE